MSRLRTAPGPLVHGLTCLPFLGPPFKQRVVRRDRCRHTCQWLLGCARHRFGRLDPRRTRLHRLPSQHPGLQPWVVIDVEHVAPGLYDPVRFRIGIRIPRRGPCLDRQLLAAESDLCRVQHHEQHRRRHYFWHPRPRLAKHCRLAGHAPRSVPLCEQHPPGTRLCFRVRVRFPPRARSNRPGSADLAPPHLPAGPTRSTPTRHRLLPAVRSPSEVSTRASTPAASTGSRSSSRSGTGPSRCRTSTSAASRSVSPTSRSSSTPARL